MISLIYDWLEKKNADLVVGLAFGLVGLVFGLVGLVFGLAAGLVFGLATGLVFGLATGLAAGLATGLAFGLAFGLATGLAFGLAGGFVDGGYGLPILTFIIGVLVLMEVVYLIQAHYFKHKPYTVWMVVAKKLEALFDVLLVGVNILNVRWIIMKYGPQIDWTKTWTVTLSIIGYLGVALTCIGILYGYIKLNQYLANKNNKKKTKKE